MKEPKRSRKTAAVHCDTAEKDERRDRYVMGDFSELITPELVRGARSKGAFTSNAYDTVPNITQSRPIAQDAYAAAKDAYVKRKA